MCTPGEIIIKKKEHIPCDTLHLLYKPGISHTHQQRHINLGGGGGGETEVAAKPESAGLRPG